MRRGKRVEGKKDWVWVGKDEREISWVIGGWAMNGGWVMGGW